MLLSSKAVYSGKGTPMVSKNGIATITFYNCFKENLTEEEKKRTGLRPSLPSDKIEQILEKDPFRNVQPKVNSKYNIGSSSAVQEIRN
jgi:hypothetical protein